MSVTRVRSPNTARASEESGGGSPRPARVREETSSVDRGVAHLVSVRRTANGQRPRASTESSARASHPSPHAVQARLDAFRSSFAGPYLVDGRREWVDPHFRMNGGYGTNPSEALKRARKVLPSQIMTRLQGALLLTATGKATPHTLVRVTQALIDAGAHREFGEGAAAIRKMMWSYGIGVDCSGYCRQAFMATRGVSEASARARYGIGRSSNGFDPDQLSRFRKVSPLSVRAGDVGKLGLGRDNHKVIVASHDVIPAQGAAPEVPGHGPLPQSFHAGGRVHIFQVDSSWGAGPSGSASGGVGRRVWVYSEASGLWGSYHASSGKLETSRLGPYGYELNGFFRPRRED